MKTLSYLEQPNTDPKFIGRIESECAWMRNKIEQIKTTKLRKRPGSIREIRDLEYQLRHRELELTFRGPEWAKYEKYGIWPALSR
jgi:hypothetical protein